MDLLVSSCEGGSIRVWSLDKKFLREIAFPHRVDSVCFFNASGDILVSHEKRVSLIAFDRYKTESFDYVAQNLDQSRRLPASDELFEDLKVKDDQVRGKKVPRPKMTGGKGSTSPRGESKPGSPATKKRDNVHQDHRKARGTRLAADEDVPQEHALKDRPSDKRRLTRNDHISKTVRDPKDDMRPRVAAPRFEPSDGSAGGPDVLDVPKPYKVTALPPIHRRLRSMKPIPGVSYLSTSGLYDDLVGDRKRFPPGHMTRRNITEHKISSNILSHNSPVVVQNFDSLNLGPQLPRHRRFASTFGHQDDPLG